MATRGHRRPPGRGPLAILGLLAPVLGLVLVGALWMMLSSPFAADGDAGERSARGTALRVETSRSGDRARVHLAGRVRSGGGGPVVLRLLGRADVAGPCPVPIVRPSGTIAVPDGGVRVGWHAISGRTPGQPLARGAAFRATGTVATRGDGALRLCAHLVRGGARPAVLKTVRVVVPSRRGITPLSVAVRPIVDDVVIPVLRGAIALAIVAAALLAAIMIRRRVRWSRPVRGPVAPPDRPEPSWAVALDLPPLPEGVRVPDAPPWLVGEDAPDDGDATPRGGGPPSRGDAATPTPRGAATETVRSRADAATETARDPAAAATEAVQDPAAAAADALAPTSPAVGATPRSRGVAGASAAAVGARREQLWRARRRKEAEESGATWDPTERAPFHVRAWAIGAEGERLAAETFDALLKGYPRVHVLHDRRAPFRHRANIDHVLVGPAGVVVADTKHWAGNVRIVDDRLKVRGLDRTGAVEGVCGQVSAVRAVLTAAGLGAVPVVGVLHWTRTDDVPLDGSIELAGVALLDARGTMMRAIDGGVLGADGVRQVLAVLEAGLPPA